MRNRIDQQRIIKRQISWSSAKPRDQNKEHRSQQNYLRRENRNEKERYHGTG